MFIVKLMNDIVGLRIKWNIDVLNGKIRIKASFRLFANLSDIFITLNANRCKTILPIFSSNQAI